MIEERIFLLIAEMMKNLKISLIKMLNNIVQNSLLLREFKMKKKKWFKV